MVYLLNSDILYGRQKSTGFYLFIGKAGEGHGTPGTSGIEQLSTCVMTSTSASLQQQLNIIMSDRGVDVPVTWDFPLEEGTQFLRENCSSLSRQAERAETFSKPLPPYPPFLQGLS